MKFTSLIAGQIIFVLTVSSAMAQFTPGKNFISGRANLSGVNPGESDTHIEPTIAHVLNERMIVGASVLLSVPPFGADYTIGVSPFVQSVFPASEKAGGLIRVGPILQQSSFPDEVTGLTFGAVGQLGGYYFVTEKFSVEVVLAEAYFQRTSMRFEGEEVDDASFWGIGLFGTGPTISVSYHF